jgi:hypothetical protein
MKKKKTKCLENDANDLKKNVSKNYYQKKPLSFENQHGFGTK